MGERPPTLDNSTPVIHSIVEPAELGLGDGLRKMPPIHSGPRGGIRVKFSGLIIWVNLIYSVSVYFN